MTAFEIALTGDDTNEGTSPENGTTKHVDDG
jgi:hypothetical protein